MKRDVLPADAAQQYFPTYHVPAEKQEITLREYDLSAQALTADQRSISVAAGLAVIAISFSGTVLASDKGLGTLKTSLTAINHVGEIALVAALAGLSLAVVRYFAELQRNATFAARKIVVLRRLLGVDYGTQERVFPTDRIEGANEPFAIPMFPGWGSIGSLATIIVATFGAALLVSLIFALGNVTGSLSSSVIGAVPSTEYRQPVATLLALSILLIIYRMWLLESWETARFLFGAFVAHELSMPLKQRMGHVLYRLELSVFEAQRVGILLEAFIPILLAIEDKRFFKHNGNDWKAVARALWYRWKYGLRSGGSTLDQQLFRSNCLARLNRTWARKPVEWAMGPWIRSRFGADQIVRMYLCSVRFDRGVIGLPAAAVHFFDLDLHSKSSWIASKAQAFFLIERLSNVTRTIPTARIRALLRGLLKSSLFETNDIEELQRIYLEQIGRGLITGSMSDVEFIPLNEGVA